MTPDKIAVFIGSIAAIGFTYWFFLMKKETGVRAQGSITITVDGGYTPNTITIPKGKPFTLNFYRKDPSSCLEEVMLPDFKIRRQLALNKTTAIQITPHQSGAFTYSCGMNMFFGKIIVTE